MPPRRTRKLPKGKISPLYRGPIVSSWYDKNTETASGARSEVGILADGSLPQLCNGPLITNPPGQTSRYMYSAPPGFSPNPSPPSIARRQAEAYRLAEDFGSTPLTSFDHYAQRSPPRAKYVAQTMAPETLYQPQYAQRDPAYSTWDYSRFNNTQSEGSESNPMCANPGCGYCALRLAKMNDRYNRAYEQMYQIWGQAGYPIPQVAEYGNSYSDNLKADDYGNKQICMDPDCWYCAMRRANPDERYTRTYKPMHQVWDRAGNGIPQAVEGGNSRSNGLETNGYEDKHTCTGPDCQYCFIQRSKLEQQFAKAYEPMYYVWDQAEMEDMNTRHIDAYEPNVEAPPQVLSAEQARDAEIIFRGWMRSYTLMEALTLVDPSSTDGKRRLEQHERAASPAIDGSVDAPSAEGQDTSMDIDSSPPTAAGPVPSSSALVEDPPTNKDHQLVNPPRMGYKLRGSDGRMILLRKRRYTN